jgi:CheY-like chemotaxis protein
MANPRQKILVVDDERALASTLSAIFESLNYETATAYSGEEAIQVASSFHPDCIVSDVMMGTINGIEAAVEILGTLPQSKVLLMSGDAPCLDLLEYANARGFDFKVLQKPVPLPELLTRVSQLLSMSPGRQGCCVEQPCALPMTPQKPASVSVVALEKSVA